MEKHITIDERFYFQAVRELIINKTDGRYVFDDMLRKLLLNPKSSVEVTFQLDIPTLRVKSSKPNFNFKI